VKKDEKRIYYFLIIAYSFLFFFIIGGKGPLIEADSAVYIDNLVDSRSINYIAYIKFIDLFQLLFADHSLYAVYIAQSVLAIICTFVLSDYLGKICRLSLCERITAYVLLTMPYGYSLPESVCTHHILTEGLSIPLFYIFFLITLRLFFGKKWQLVNACLLLDISILMMLVRTQMAIFVAVAIVILLAKVIATCVKNTRKAWLGMTIALLVGTTIMICILPLISRLLLNATSHGSQLADAMSGRAFILAEKDDQYRIDNQAIQYLFNLIYEDEEREGRLLFGSLPGLFGVDKMMDDINSINKELLVKIYSNYDHIPNGMHLPEGLSECDIRHIMVDTLLVNHAIEYRGVSLLLMEKSLVASIFIQPDRFYMICHIIAYFMYVCSWILLFISYKRKVSDEYFIPFIITQLIMIINIYATNIIFYGLQRYVIYTMGLFYISILLMLKGCGFFKEEGITSE